MKAYAYIRIDGNPRTPSWQDQLSLIKQWCHDNGYDLEAIHGDECSASAKWPDRKGLTKLLSGRRLDNRPIVVWSMSALVSTDWAAEVAQHVLGALDSRIAPVVPDHGSIHPSADRRAARDVLGTLEGMTAATKAYGRSGSRRAALQAGKHVGGRVPYGFTVDASGALTWEASERGRTLLWLMRHRSDHSLRGLADAANQGVRDGRLAPAPNGGLWTHGIVRRVIQCGNEHVHAIPSSAVFVGVEA